MDGPQGPYKRIFTGVYEDARGQVVITVADILRDLGIPDTPEHRTELMDLIQQRLQEEGLFRQCFRNTPYDPTFRRVQ